MVYRMLAIDIDGTLLQSNNKLNRRSKDAIEFVKKKDVYITLVTERHFHSAKKVAKALKINPIIITQNGAFIAASADKPIYEKRLHPELAGKLVDALEEYDCHVRVSHERFSIGNRVRQTNELIAKMTIGMGDPLFYPVTFVDTLGDYLRDNGISPTKIDVQFFEPEIQSDAIEEIIETFPEISITQGEGGACEICARGVSKAKGLQFLANRLGFSQEEIVAVGDSYSDKTMIARAGLGVAMKNAPEEVKYVADWVTRSNNQNGFAYMVMEVFRKQLRMQI